METKPFIRWYLTASLLLLFLLTGCGNTADKPPASEIVGNEKSSGKDMEPTATPEPAETPEPTEEVHIEEEFDPLPPGQKYGKISVSRDRKTIYVHGWVDPYDLSDRRTKKAEKIVFCEDAGILAEECDFDGSIDASYASYLNSAPLVKEVVVEKGNPFLYAKDSMLIKRKGADQYTDGDQLVFCVPRKKGAVRVPESVECIGRCAFIGCSGITSVRFPASSSLYEGCFADMKSCKSIQVDKKSNKDTLLYTKDGILYTREFLEYAWVIAYPAGKTDRVYKAPENTWGISPCAFQGADHLREVYLPSRLKEIKEYTFSDCKNLRKVVVKNKKKISLVDGRAFLNCPNLEEHVKDKDW